MYFTKIVVSFQLLPEKSLNCRFVASTGKCNITEIVWFMLYLPCSLGKTDNPWLGHWIIGSLGHWVIGSLDHWIIGSLDHWIIGLSDYREVYQLFRFKKRFVEVGC